MKVKDLFDVVYGVNLELVTLETVPNSDSNGVNFVARTAVNNGVVARVHKIDGLEPQPKGILSCAGSGSVLSTFVQTEPFYSGRDLYTLTPKKDLTLQEKLFYCMCIKANAYRFSYGRQANKSLRDIDLPDTLPEWVYDTSITPISTKIKHKRLPPLNVEKWGEFRVGDIFILENCRCSTARDLLSDGNDCYYIGAKKSDNGVMRCVAYDGELITKGNCVVFICDGQGSVGYSNYMDKDFVGSTTLTVGRNRYINKYVGMFLVSVLDLERPKYSFGRKYRTKLADTIIKLPKRSDCAPDWDYMEKYIKSLPYSDRI